MFDLFRIGIGPSSSHTVGPMRAARMFATALDSEGLLETATGVRVELFGSLGATGKGHGTGPAVVLGLEGAEPDKLDPDVIAQRVEGIRAAATLRLLGRHAIAFRPDEDVRFHALRSLPKHPNGMTFTASRADGSVLAQRTYYSVGGGFVVDDSIEAAPPGASMPVPRRFTTGAELLALCGATQTRGRCP